MEFNLEILDMDDPDGFIPPGEKGWISDETKGQLQFWKDETLWKAAEGSKTEKISLDLFKDAQIPWRLYSVKQKKDVYTMDMMRDDIKRVEKADLTYPVIYLKEPSKVKDGWHRILKAMVRGQKFILAKRLDKMPPPDRVKFIRR